MIKLIVWLIFLVACCYGALCLVLYVRQRSLLFYPVPEVRSDEAEALYIENESQRLKIWHIPGKNGKALIYFGGNAEDVSLNMTFFKKILPQWSVFLCNYRGYGGSSGIPTEKALFSDALAVYDIVSENHESTAVMGRSLGTGVAVFLASRKDVERMVLVTPYDSMVAVAASYYPVIPVSLLMKDRFDSIDMTEYVDVPVLVIIAGDDEVIPMKNSRRLAAALEGDQTEVVILEGAGHNTVELSKRYPDLLQEFLH